jgi:G3E family GTPase
MSVSIAAGPAVTGLLARIDPAIGGCPVGLLTSLGTPAPKGVTIFPLPPESDPARILSEIRTIAATGRVHHLIIECEPDRPAMAYASLFVSAGPGHQTLNDESKLSGVAFAIQTTALLDSILGRGPTSLPGCFLAEQLEFVSHIFLESHSDDRNSDLGRSIAAALNPGAHIAPLSEFGIGQYGDPNRSSFDFEAALNSAGWRRLLDTPQPRLLPDKEVTAFGYRAQRPFHPQRFWDLLHQGWHDVFRAKGFFWLATRMNEVGGLNVAGSDLHCASAGAWWATRDQSIRDAEMPERTRAEWREPFGDRRQAFAVMALDLDLAVLQRPLDACLLTDDEMSEGPAGWKDFPDPFPSWSSHHHAHQHDHDCDHDHGSEEHDCCHH